MERFLAIVAIIGIVAAAAASTERQPARQPERQPAQVIDPCNRPASELGLLQLQECQPRLEALIRAQIEAEDARKRAVRAASGLRF
jgi:hypothetical protein